MPKLNDGLNAVNVLRKIVLFNEQFHMQGNYDDTLIKIHDRSVLNRIKLQILLI